MDTVGVHPVVVDSVVDLICGLEAFAFNSVDCVFDRVKIVEGGVSASETQVGDSVFLG